MSMPVQSPGYEVWSRPPDDSDIAPNDCDCGGTIRELLAEIAGTATVFLLIILLVRALQ